MAGRGPAPKPDEERRRRNAVLGTVEVAADGVLRGPALPDTLDWPDVTREWWDTWRRSPQAQTFTATDWSFLLDTAVLHMEFWDGDRSVAAELRLRAAKFGATPEDRARLRLSVTEEPAKPAATSRRRAPAARTRRERLLKAVGDGG